MVIIVKASSVTPKLEEYNLRFCKAAAPGGQSLVFADISNERATLSALVKNCVLIGVLCFAAFFGISFRLAFWMVQPVEKAWQQQRQFVADASHELKTPLTVIISNAELLQLPEYDEASRACFSGRILASSRQMRGLVERLLELARADREQNGAEHVPINLSELAKYALLPFEPLFFEKDLKLLTEIQPDIQVLGDGQRLQQMIDILLDNAQKYAPSPGIVRFALRRGERRRCLLSVSNACEPVEKEELKTCSGAFTVWSGRAVRMAALAWALPLQKVLLTNITAASGPSGRMGVLPSLQSFWPERFCRGRGGVPARKKRPKSADFGRLFGAGDGI